MARKRNAAAVAETQTNATSSKTKRNQAVVAGGNQVTTDDTVLDASADIAALEALLSDDEINLSSPEPDVAEVEEDDLADEISKELNAKEAKEASYKAKTPTVATASYDGPVEEFDISDVADDEEIAAETPEKKAKTPRAVKLTFEDALQRMHDAEPLVLDVEEGPIDSIEVITKEVTQKKVKEKVVNLLQGVLVDGKISVYTVIALEALKTAYLEDRLLTSEEIRKAFEAKGYKSGTVNAQSGQMLTLFPALKMVTREGRSALKPNKNSVLLDVLCS
jgi:hypothetical protein